MGQSLHRFVCIHVHVYKHTRTCTRNFVLRAPSERLPMGQSLYILIHIYVHVNIYTHTLLFCARLLKISSTRASVLTYIDMYICTFENTRTNTLLFCARLLNIAATYGSVLTCIDMYICIYIHTHTHTFVLRAPSEDLIDSWVRESCHTYE